jgi:hypothetical protein
VHAVCTLPAILSKDLHKIKSECYPHIPLISAFQMAAYQQVPERFHSLVYLIYQHIALRTALFWIITQRVVAIYYRRFGKTYRSHLQGSRILIRLEKPSTPHKCHREQESLGVGYLNVSRKSEVHVQCTVFKKKMSNF